MSVLPASRLARRSALAVGLAAGLATGPLMGQDLDEAAHLAGAIEQRVRDVFTKCRDAVVRIEASDNHGRIAGSGFFIDPNGTLYTSYSIGGETDDISVAFRGEQLPARRIISDLRSGIAILKVEAETPFLVFGNSHELAVASPVMTVGFPFDLPITPGLGTIGGREIKYGNRYFATAHLRANVPVQRGQGGAPLLNLRGQVVGILISSLDQGSASFALPIEAAEKVRRDFLRFHEVRRGWVGFELEPLPNPRAGSTVMVKDVFPDSPAQKAGVQPGDILVQLGERAITSTDDVIDASFFLTADDPTALRVMRGEQEIPLEVQVGEHPGDGGGLKRIAPAFVPGPELSVPRLDEDR